MAKAKLFIRGLKEPIDIEKEEADMLSALKSDPARDDRTTINIEGVWTGTKGDIKYVMFPKSEEPAHTSRFVEPMTDFDAKAFQPTVDECIEEAKKEGFLAWDWRVFYMKRQGAIRLDFFDISPEKRGYRETVINEFEYPKVQEKIDSYNEWKSRKEYGEKMRIKALEETAKTL